MRTDPIYGMENKVDEDEEVPDFLLLSKDKKSYDDKKYVKETVLFEEKAGNVVQYSLNLSNAKSRIYAGFIAEFGDIERMASYAVSLLSNEKKFNLFR